MFTSPRSNSQPLAIIDESLYDTDIKLLIDYTEIPTLSMKDSNSNQCHPITPHPIALMDLSTTDQQSNLVWRPQPDIPSDYESVFIQQIKCSKSQMPLEVGTILVVLLPITDDMSVYRMCCVLSVIESLMEPVAVRVFDGFKVCEGSYLFAILFNTCILPLSGCCLLC